MNVMHEIAEERKRQDQKWGEQNHEPLYWLGVLMEEVGESSKAVIEGNMRHYREELVQVAAVAVAAIESFDRGHQRLPRDIDSSAS